MLNDSFKSWRRAASRILASRRIVSSRRFRSVALCPRSSIVAVLYSYWARLTRFLREQTHLEETCGHFFHAQAPTIVFITP